MPLTSSIPANTPSPTQQSVRELARKAGFTVAGMVALPHPETERDAARFAEFVTKKRSGTMQYLERRNQAGELVRSRVGVPFPWARSAIVCLASYHADAPLSTAPAPTSAGWIARYAWSGRKDDKGETRPSDYHKVLLKALRAMEAELRCTFGDFESRTYVDTGPVVERSIARAAGLGWTGKNTCLIHPKLGSFHFLAVLVTSLEISPEHAALAVPDRCGSCRRCLDACPTQALVEPYQMDASRCIAYLTIEHRGEIATDLQAGMGRHIFGCDICQDVCPWNRKAPIGLANPDLAARGELVNPGLDWLASLEERDFERLFNGSPVRRAGFMGLRRNLAIAIGNSGVARFLPILERWAEDRPEELVAQSPESENVVRDRETLRGAAREAIRRLTRPDCA